MSVITIDCWGTLVKGSPVFQKKKLEFTQLYFPSRSEKDIYVAYHLLKQTFNDIIESTGIQPRADTIFQYLFTKLHGGYQYYNFPYLQDFINHYQELAIKYPPEIYSPETETCLRDISKNYTLILCSNTMMIGGNTLKYIMEQNGLGQHFQGYRFSDLCGIAKPNPQMFLGSTLHIGDNAIIDGEGSRKCGVKSIIINSQGKTIKDAHDYITGNR